MNKIRAKLLTKHSKKCRAIDSVKLGLWKHPWAFIHRFERRDSLGRKPRGTGERWAIVICNDSNCKAQLAINEDDIINFVSKN